MTHDALSTFTSAATPPDWCELRRFRHHRPIVGENVRVEASERCRVLVTAGTVQVRCGDTSSAVLKERQFLDVRSGPAEIVAVSDGAEFVWLEGNWGDELGGCGIFEVRNQESPSDIGDPVDYRKTTTVDSHYHDCDEYWIVLSGRGVVVVGDRRATVGPGDCVPIGMGHHHDLPEVTDPIRAVFFETTLRGEKRVGHLWNHTHGPARPQAERI